MYKYKCPEEDMTKIFLKNQELFTYSFIKTPTNQLSVKNPN